MRLALLLVHEPPGPRDFRLEEGTAMVGRGAGCALRIEDPAVSFRHALLCASPEGFYVADQQSTNGTWVNGARIETAWLEDGDLVRLGPQGPALRVALRSAEPLPRAPTVAAPGRGPRAPVLPATSPVPEGGAVVRTLDRTAIARAMKGPEAARPRSSVLTWLAALAVIGFFGLLVAGLLLLELGPAGFFAGAFAAFLPAPFYVAVFVWLDRYDPEPRWALAGAFAWGALFAILISAIGNTVFGVTATALSSRPTGEFLTAVVSAPLIEEGTKGLGLFLVLLAFRRHFDGVVDGIVYAGLIALGFATVENVQYYGRSFLKGGFGGVFVLAVLRGGLSPFAHALFTAMTGIGCGIARESHRRAVKVLAPLLGLAGAVLLHAAWNFVASLGVAPFFLVYVLVWVPLFCAFLGAIAWLARREVRILREMLAPEVASGLITQEQLDVIASVFRRIGWRMSALGDRARYRARREFLEGAARLALCYWHVVRASEAGVYTMSLPRIPKARDELHALAGRV